MFNCTIKTVLLIAALGLAACQTTAATSDPDQAASSTTTTQSVSREVYSPFYDQADHLADLLDQGKTDMAAKLYGEQKAFFIGNPKTAGLLERLKQNLNADYEPAFNQALTALSPFSNADNQTDWPRLKQAIQQADTALQAYPVQEAALRSETANRLQQKMDELAHTLRADSSRHFRTFNHFGTEGFFALYPVKLDSQSIFKAEINDVLASLKTASTQDFAAFTLNYPRETMGEDNWNRLGSIYVQRWKKENPRAKGLLATIGAVTAAKTLGFDDLDVPETRITFVEATSKTLLREGQIDFPVAIDHDLPIQVDMASLDDALSGPVHNGNRHVIIFEVALAKASRRVIDLDYVDSILFAGFGAMSTTSDNPDNANAVTYDHLVGAGDSAKSATLPDSMSAYNRTGMGAPQYYSYQFSTAKIQARKHMTVNYYVIDRKLKTYVKSVFDVSLEERFRVAYNVHRADPRKKNIQREYDTEKDVDDFEKESVDVSLSQLLSAYASNQKIKKPLPSLAALRGKMLADKNTVLANKNANEFDARPLNDPRFDSVVAIYEGKGGMGSGFFITPDIVMTNWHVVDKAKFVEMKLYDGRETFGSVLAKDVRLDIALVKVQTRGRPVAFYTGRNLNLGKTVEAIGHPRRHLFSITRGIVSAVRKEHSISLPKHAGDKVLYVQTDTPINGGNSGGPLFLGDKVVAMNTMGYPSTDGLNFAVHYSELLNYVNEHLPGFHVPPSGKGS